MERGGKRRVNNEDREVTRERECSREKEGVSEKRMKYLVYF